KKQVKEWQHLFETWEDEDGNSTKKEWKEFAFANEDNFEKEIIKDGKLNKNYQYLPIDTQYFPELKYQMLSQFENLDEIVDGTLIKTDNWQGLNTLKEKYKGKIDLTYIDPPFNTGSD